MAPQLCLRDPAPTDGTAAQGCARGSAAAPAGDDRRPRDHGHAQGAGALAVVFTVPGEPKGKGRHRTRVVKTSAGRTFASAYTPQPTVQYENLVRLMASQAMAGREPIDGPVTLDMRVTVAVPRSWSKRKTAQALLGEIRPTGKPDLDNIAKAIFDGMNAVVFRDDAQIVEARHAKAYGATPGVWVAVTPGATAHCR